MSHNTEWRNYTSHKLGETPKLSTWIQRKCEVCRKFLSKKQHRFCSLHGNKKNQQRRLYLNYMEEIKEISRLRKKVLNHIEEFEVGDYI